MLKQKKLIAGIITAGVITGNMGILSYANEKDLTVDEIMSIPGLIQIKSNYGEEATPSYIYESKVLDKTLYGFPMLNEVGVVDFVEWLVKNDERYAEIFDMDNIKEIVGTDKFDNLWVKASELDEYNFALKQQLYIMETQMQPIIEKIKSNTNVDIEGNKILEELLFVTVSDFGANAVKFVEEALSKYKNIEEVDIESVIDEVIDAKIAKLKGMKSLTEGSLEAKERALLKESKYLKELYNFEKNYEKLNGEDSLVEFNKIDVDKELDEMKDAVNKKDKDKIKESLFSLMSRLLSI